MTAMTTSVGPTTNAPNKKSEASRTRAESEARSEQRRSASYARGIEVDAATKAAILGCRKVDQLQAWPRSGHGDRAHLGAVRAAVITYSVSTAAQLADRERHPQLRMVTGTIGLATANLDQLGLLRQALAVGREGVTTRTARRSPAAW